VTNDNRAYLRRYLYFQNLAELQTVTISLPSNTALYTLPVLQQAGLGGQIGLVGAVRPSEAITIAPAISRLPITTATAVKPATVQSSVAQAMIASTANAPRLPVAVSGVSTAQQMAVSASSAAATRPTLKVIIPNSRSTDEV
jgi:hypothetical protein